MANTYSEQEKQTYLSAFRLSGKTRTAFARENNIPEATFRAWFNAEQQIHFGTINIERETDITAAPKIPKQVTIFSSENIKIELREGFDKDMLRKIVEVLINDK